MLGAQLGADRVLRVLMLSVAGIAHLCVLLFSGFFVHPEDQVLGQLQFYNPAKLLGAELLSAAFLGQSRAGRLVGWLLDMDRLPNRTELLVDCQKKRILATKLKQVS